MFLFTFSKAIIGSQEPCGYIMGALGLAKWIGAFGLIKLNVTIAATASKHQSLNSQRILASHEWALRGAKAAEADVRQLPYEEMECLQRHAASDPCMERCSYSAPGT